MAEPETDATPVAPNNALAARVPAVPICTFPLVAIGDARINVSKTSPSVLSSGLAQSVEPIRIGLHDCRPLVGASRATAPFQNLARLGIPPMSLPASKVLSHRRTQILAFEADQMALRQQIKKPLTHGCPCTHATGRRASRDDARAPFEFMSVATSKTVIRLGADPLSRQ
ncbi:hypothetical protein C9I56_35350 [Paraburkholderia caribensis]|nr:hypothetical protein C9I56_35350 [Paraburkholderia caribensis]